MTDFLVILKAMACFGIFWRLYTYRWEGDARYRLSITLIAYILMFCAGAQAISIFMEPWAQASPYEVAILWCVNILIWAANGNLARVLSVSDSSHVPRWHGFDRRKRR